MKPQLNPLSANPTKWSNTLKQFDGKLPTNCLSVFDHFVGLALELNYMEIMLLTSDILVAKVYQNSVEMLHDHYKPMQ